jgi:hypothetical protein
MPLNREVEMSTDALYSLVARVFWIGAFALLVFAVLEALVNFRGYTILSGAYSPGRLLELSAVLLVFVLSLLLRQIRQELRSEKARG